MQFLTDFFDQAVVLPLAFVIFLVLLAAGWRRGAFAWAATAMLCWLTMLALKLGVQACLPPPTLGSLASPSGHVATGTFIYAGATALWAGWRRGWLAAIPVAALIAVTRVALGAHSVPDVLVGAAVGVGAVGLLTRLAGPRARRPNKRWLIAPAIAILLLHGRHLPVETHILRLARHHAFWPLTLCTPASASRHMTARRTMSHGAINPPSDSKTGAARSTQPAPQTQPYATSGH